MRKWFLTTLLLTAMVQAEPLDDRPLFENNESYRVDSDARFSVNRLYRGHARSGYNMAADVTMRFDNLATLPGLYLGTSVAGYSVGPEFAMSLGYHKRFENLFFDLGLIKYKFYSQIDDNVLEGYQRVGVKLENLLLTLSLYEELDSSHDELFDTLVRLLKGFTPRYLGSELRLQWEGLDTFIGYNTIQKFYIQTDYYLPLAFIPQWELVSSIAYNQSGGSVFGLAGLELNFGLVHRF